VADHARHRFGQDEGCVQANRNGECGAMAFAMMVVAVMVPMAMRMTVTMIVAVPVTVPMIVPVVMRMAVVIGVIMAIMVIVVMAVIVVMIAMRIVGPGRGIVSHNGPFAAAALHKCRSAARFSMPKWRYLWSNSSVNGNFWKMLTFVKVDRKDNCPNLWFL
jgi:hypothetical protein